MIYLRLTACDHENNGFVHIVSWPFENLGAAKIIAAEIEAMDTDEARPDVQTCDFNFIVDFVEADRVTHFDDTKALSLQTAMSLAPDLVLEWLNKRPDPDSISNYEPIIEWQRHAA